MLPSIKIDPEAPHPDTHVRCPECRELVRMDARKCKHCGNGLRPFQ
ncbi:zinc ribbon domain-containing protein [Chromobacterium vaccinii]